MDKNSDGEKRPVEQLVMSMRELELDHAPDGWPAVQMKDISALCDAVESATPALDLLQARLEKGAVIAHQNSFWWLFDKNGEGICSGSTIRLLLISLIFVDS